MIFRACIAAALSAFLMLLGPAAAQADHGFSVSKTQAGAGEEVEFQISGTQAGESYIVKVDEEEVASGVDVEGNGVTETFNMPDFGSSAKAVSVEVDITPVGGDPNHRGSRPMQYVVASSGSGGQPAPQPVPTKTVADPVPLNEPVVDSTPSNSGDKKSDKGGKKEGSGKKPDSNSNGTGGSGKPTSNPTSDDSSSASPVSTPTAASGSSSSSGSTPSKSPGFGAAIKNQVPPGPTGPTAPVGGAIATALSPLSGLAEPGTTGFPILLILLFVILGALAVTAGGPRLWQRYEPELPWGPKVDDDTRLTALGRASASGAELQQTIAARKASRSTGRSSNGAGSNGAGEHSKTLTRH
jgi:hypothetical protein